MFQILRWLGSTTFNRTYMFDITLNSRRRFSQIRFLLNVSHKGFQDVPFADPVFDLALVTIEVSVRYLEDEPVLQPG